MHIVEMLKKEFIIDELGATTKRDALLELSRVIFADRPDFDPAIVLDVLLEREKLGSTGIGDGIAIPHGKLNNIDNLMISFGRSRRGVDFNAMDGKPVHLFFLLLAPENSTGQHLKALAKISKMLKDPTFREDLMKAKSNADIFRIIGEKDDAY